MTSPVHYEVLFHRHPANPILTAANWPYPAHTVFNAGATRLQDGTTLLLCRVEDRRGHSHLCAARSDNGVDGWRIDPEPTLWPDPERHPEEVWGIEDPRITFVDELGKYAVTYTAFSTSGPGVALALTSDFRTFERCGLVMQPDDKDAALLPRRINGRFALLHRPWTDPRADIWISYSPDLRNWGGHKMVLPARREEREDEQRHAQADHEDQGGARRAWDARRDDDVEDQQEHRHDVEDAVREHRADERRPGPLPPGHLPRQHGDPCQLADPARQQGVREQADGEG